MPYTDADLEAFHAMDMAEDRLNIDSAKAILKKMKVAELRVLAAHFWRMRPTDLWDMSKTELVDEIAVENTTEVLEAAGRQVR